MVRSKKALFGITLIISIALSSFTTLIFLQHGRASPNPIILPDPQVIKIPYCATADIAICVENFTDLYGFEFKIWWRKNVVEYTGYEWKPYPPPWTIPLTVGPVFDENETHKAVSFAISPMPPNPPFSYSGRWPFIDIYWHCIQPGAATTLTFDRDYTHLVNQLGELIPIEKIIDGLIINEPETPEDLELYPREVVDLEDPTGTQWHELHPYKTNYYHLISWQPGKVLSPEDQIDMYAIEPPEKIWVETTFVDPISPYGSEWHEIEPTFCQWWTFTSWEDNGDGYLSECDQIDMSNMVTGEVVWFHVQWIDPPGPEPGPRMMHLDVKYWFQVDEVTIDLVIWDEYDTLHWLDYECGYWTFNPKNPVCTKWNEIKPDSGRCWHLTAWYDFNMNDYIDMGDEIIMIPMYPFSGPSQYCIVKSVTISLMLTPLPSPPVVPPPPIGPMYLESEISYDEFDLTNPVCTTWHEILPLQGRRWHLSSWHDRLGFSPSDWIVLALKDEFGEPIPGTETEYHVDKLTVAMNMTSTYDGMEHIVKFEGSLKQFKQYRWSEPWGTQWHEVNPTYCRQWYLAEWLDDGDLILDYCDLILMIDKETGEPEEFHVESLSTDMYVTQAHDIAVINVTTSKEGCIPMPVAHQGYTANVSVTILNEGYSTENVNVTAYATNSTNSYAIGNQTFNNLAPSAQATLTFVWNASLFSKGNYTISAKATPVPGETDLSDNEFTDGIVAVVHVADVNADGKVDLKDVFAVALAYGSFPGHPKWNPNLDINDDGKIDLKDYFMAALNYGAVDP